MSELQADDWLDSSERAIMGRHAGYEWGGMLSPWCGRHGHSWTAHNAQVTGVGVRCRHCHHEMKTYLCTPLPSWLNLAGE